MLLGSSVTSVQGGSEAEATDEVGSDAPELGHGFVDRDIAGEIGRMDAPEAAQIRCGAQPLNLHPYGREARVARYHQRRAPTRGRSDKP